MWFSCSPVCSGGTSTDGGSSTLRVSDSDSDRSDRVQPVTVTVPGPGPVPSSSSDCRQGKVMSSILRNIDKTLVTLI
jgi:hypothetical protein